MATFSVQLDGVRDYVLRLDVTPGTPNQSANTTPVSWALRVDDVANWGSFGSYSTAWSINVGSGSSGSIASFPAGDFTIASGTKTIAHNADGTKTLSVSGTWDSKHSNIGKGTASGSITLTRIPKVPATMSAPTLSAATVAGLTVAWSAPNNMGSGITGYDIQYSTASNFSGATTLAVTGSSRALTGLAPATTYYVRMRAKNGVGAGAWSASSSLKTLTALYFIDPATNIAEPVVLYAFNGTGYDLVELFVDPELDGTFVPTG